MGVDLALLVFEHAWLMSILEAVALPTRASGHSTVRSIAAAWRSSASGMPSTSRRLPSGCDGYAQRRLRAFRTNARRKHSSSSTSGLKRGTSRSVSSFHRTEGIDGTEALLGDEPAGGQPAAAFR